MLVCLAMLTLSACSGPFLLLPGGELAGPEVMLEVNAIPSNVEALQLETNPLDPYSVNIGFRLIDGQLYIDPADERQWYKYIQTDPNVRIRIGDAESIHQVLAVRVTDPAIVAQFDEDRHVFRLDPKF